MFHTIGHYLKVYGKFVATSSAVNMQFRIHFLMLILVDIFFFGSALMAVSFIYDHIATIGPWNRDQFLFFVSFMLMIDTIHMTVISASFWQFSEDIKTGEFDYILIRPLNSVFISFFRWFRPSGVAGFFVAGGILIHYGLKVGLSPLDWACIPIFIVLGLLLQLVLEFILSVSMFWLVEGNGINMFRMQLQQLSRWPEFVFVALSRKVFLFVLPILLVGSAPVHFLLDVNRFELLLYMLLAIVVGLVVLSRLWRFGIRHYDSASS